NITEDELRKEFEPYGEVEEVFIKAFITYASPEDAQIAKEATDTKLKFPGAERPCDVMLAKNQGMSGSPGPAGAAPQALAAEAPRKVFVGSMPDGIEAEVVRSAFSVYGVVEEFGAMGWELFLKQGCESGRQWGFVTFASPEEAANAQEQTNGVLCFEGSIRPCQVTLARNQGLYGNGSLKPSPIIDNGPKKTTLLSPLPAMQDFPVQDMTIQSQHWGFVTFATSQQALDAKESCDRTLMLPGWVSLTMLLVLTPAGRRQEPARGSHGSHGSYSQGGSYSSNSRAPGYGATSGSYGGSRSSGPIKRPAVIGATDSMLGQGGQGTQGIPAARSYGTKGGDRNGYGTHRSHESHPYAQETRSTTSVGGPCKIFVGSLPDGCQEEMVRDEFSRYGRITDVYLKQGCESGKQWAFVIYSSAEEAGVFWRIPTQRIRDVKAKLAKESTDKILKLPGASKPCEAGREVMLAKNQGMYGQGKLGTDLRNALQSLSHPRAMSQLPMGKAPHGCDDVTALKGRARRLTSADDAQVFVSPSATIEEAKGAAVLKTSTSLELLKSMRACAAGVWITEDHGD
ncbi:unnamed protein product, partial [Cladocopium goreaui]